MINNEQKQANNPDNSNEIDILALLGILLDYKWLIAGIATFFAVSSIIYAILATPIYEATALIQVESKKSGLAGFEDMAGLEGSSSQANTEIEILKSRLVIGKAVDNLKLDINAQALTMPIIGNYLARRRTQNNEPNPAPLTSLAKYNWGGASIKIFQLDLPAHLLNIPLTLVAGNNGAYTLLNDKQLLLTGESGKPAEGNGITMQVEKLAANPDTHFIVTQRTRLNVIMNYQTRLQAAERGKQSGMIGISLQNSNAEFAKTILNEVARIYVQQNVERMSAEAASSLEFLNQQLPQVRLDMEKAEALLNQYQISAKSVDISIETQSVLNQIVQIESDLSDLKMKQMEMDKRFTNVHPSYQALLNQINTLNTSKNLLEDKVKNLPETQQELLRLARDVEVSSKIYTQLLQKAQELDIARASTVGNVRIIDIADADISNPVSPKRTLIVLIITLLGGILGIIIAFIHSLLHRGVENPADIEALELPVYASIPFSPLQIESDKKNTGNTKSLTLLASEYPDDPSIEALRSLHTSLHFAMLEASNNIIMLSGPSPKVGKSFVSVNLSALMAQAGKKVLLIDADMRKGYIHKFFSMNSADNGLSSLLCKQSVLDNTIKKTGIDNLDVISRGPIPPNPSELLLSQRLEELLTELSPQYDIIIIDTPPILAVADSLIVGKLAGASFMVVRFAENPVAEIRATIKRFETNGIKLKGAVLNATRKKSLNYYNYQKYGYSNYQYNYQSDKE